MNSLSTYVFLSYRDAANTCNDNNPATPCPALTPIDFIVDGFNYNFSCASHTYTWDFNGTQRTGKNVQHTFPMNGTYNVKLTVNNGSQTIERQATIVVAGGGNPATGDAEISIVKSLLSGTVYSFTPTADPVEAMNGATKFVWHFSGGPAGSDSTQEVHTQDPVYYNCQTWCSDTIVTLSIYNASNQLIGPPVTENLIQTPSRRRGVRR